MAESKYTRWLLVPALCISFVASTACTQLGLTEDEDDDTLTLSALALVAISGCLASPSPAASFNASTAVITDGCVSGVTTYMDSSLPTWIKNNFKCSVAFVNGSNYCFRSANLNNATSPYWGTGATLYTQTMPGANQANPNKTKSQKFIYKIPITPTRNTGSLTSTQGGLASIGITVNGLAVFNNAAAPGDTLATEATSFDSQGGHPESTGSYHHHANVVNGTGGNDLTASNSLVGIALDGYAIYGRKCSGQGNVDATGLDAYHGHETVTAHFSTATYHYHYGGTTGGGNDATAGIPTLMGSSFYGVIGSVTN